jgi:hypothetical protein
LPWRVITRASVATKAVDTASLVTSARAEVDAAGEVEQEPGAEVAVLGELAHVGLLQPRGDVPVDVAHVVVQLVLAQVGQVDAGAAQQRAVVALQQAVQAAQHRPLELRSSRRPSPAWSAAGQARARPQARPGAPADVVRAASSADRASGLSGRGTFCSTACTSASASRPSASAS